MSNKWLFLLVMGKCWHDSAGDVPSNMAQCPSLMGACGPRSTLQSTQNAHIQLATQPRTHILSHLQWITSNMLDYQQKTDMSEGRGRLPFVIPVMYNLGVITTLLVVLTVLTFKGLAIGIVILILHLQGKWKHNEHQEQSQRPVHVHLHTASKFPVPYSPYSNEPWDRQDSGDFQFEANETTLKQLFHPRSFRR